MSSSPPADQLPSENWSELERIIKAFEDAWQRGERPSVDAFLPAGAAERRALLVELVHTDLECRIKAGEGIHVEVYLARYPELAGDSGAVLDLIVAEYRQRRRREADLTAAEYCHRFPQFSAQLQELLKDPPQIDTLHPPTTGRTLFERLPDRAPGTHSESPGFGSHSTALGAVMGYDLIEELGRCRMAVVHKAR